MIDIPIANGIVFKAVDSLAQSLDNTLDRDNTRNNRTINCYKTKVGGEVNILVVSDSDQTANIMLWAYIDESTVPNPFDFYPQNTFERGGLFYHLFSYQPYWGSEYYKLIQNDGNNGQVSGGTVLMISEPTTNELDGDELLLEWYNHEPAFGLDYSNGLVPKIYLDCKFAYKQAQTEQSIYSNQGVRTKLKGTVNRVMMLVADVPDYMAETLSCIFEHDRVFINEVEYVADKSSEQQQRGESNLYRFSIDLIQKSVVGLNTHDVGFDLDSIVNNEVMVIQKLGQTGNFTVPVAAGYTFHMVTEVWKAGTGINIDMGTTALGTDLVNGDEVSVSTPILYPTPHKPFISAGTIYVTQAGTAETVDYYFQFVKNT